MAAGALYVVDGQVITPELPATKPADDQNQPMLYINGQRISP
jgi:hypothetical protein